MSSLFLRTLREDPADAEVPSHRLLVRAGYIRRAAPGIYSWLPLGYLVYRNVERIVREEMDRAGFQEVHFPALLPREPYEATNRWTEYGDNLFRSRTARGNDYLLGPDPRGDVHAARQGPVLLVQGPAAVALPDPDEVTATRRVPAAGLLRGREFVMKDSYSFDIDDDGLTAGSPTTLHRDATSKIFQPARLLLRQVPGDVRRHGRVPQREFCHLDTGEDTFVRFPGRANAAKRRGRQDTGARAGPLDGPAGGPRR
jgi:prolyl-tRNA synthetase